MVVLVHMNFYFLGNPDRDELLSSPGATFWRVFAEYLCIPGVNIFVLISGWFGIKPSVRGICALLFQVLFYGVLIMGIGGAAGLNVPIRDSIKVLFFGSYYWFIPAYIGLYAFSPVLNSFIENTDPKTIRGILYSFFAIQSVYGWITNTGSYLYGFSFVSFIGLYILARYLHLYSKKLVSLSPSTYFTIFLLAVFLPAMYTFFAIRNDWPGFSLLYYTSPFVIVSAASLLLMFTQFKIQSKVINWIASSVFSVYLFHLHPIISPILKSICILLADRLGSFSYSLFAICLAVILVLVCVLIDKIRILCWERINNGVKRTIVE